MFNMLENTIRTLNYRLKSPVLGDIRARALIDNYLEKRNRILRYQGKSAVDREKFIFYESILIEDKYDSWFHRYSEAYLNRVLWLLRRLKVGITPQEEYNLISEYYDRMPMSELYIAQYDRKSLAANKVLKNYFERNGVKMK